MRRGEQASAQHATVARGCRGAAGRLLAFTAASTCGMPQTGVGRASLAPLANANRIVHIPAYTRSSPFPDLSARVASSRLCARKGAGLHCRLGAGCDCVVCERAACACHGPERHDMAGTVGVRIARRVADRPRSSGRTAAAGLLQSPLGTTASGRRFSARRHETWRTAQPSGRRPSMV